MYRRTRTVRWPAIYTNRGGIILGLIMVSLACLNSPVAMATDPPALPEDFLAIITNSSDGAEKCLIFGAKGEAKYPSRYNWGSGPYCGFPGNWLSLIKNGQGVWRFQRLDSVNNAYMITNWSAGTEECLIFSENGQAEHPSRHNWGPGAYCGFPGGKGPLLANQQAVWYLQWIGDNNYMIMNSSYAGRRALFFSRGGHLEYPFRCSWEEDAEPSVSCRPLGDGETGVTSLLD